MRSPWGNYRVNRTIESGETDYEYFDIIVPPEFHEVQEVIVTSIFEQPISSRKNEQVWRFSDFYNIQEKNQLIRVSQEKMAHNVISKTDTFGDPYLPDSSSLERAPIKRT